MSVSTEMKNFGSCFSYDKFQPRGWQNYDQQKEQVQKHKFNDVR